MSYLGICKASKMAEIPSATDKYLPFPKGHFIRLSKIDLFSPFYRQV